MEKKQPTTVRLTAEARRLLLLLSSTQGLTQAAIIETLLRREARRLGLK